MATIIRIKRSTTSNAPTDLKTGEISYSSGSGSQSNGGDRLYFGKGDDGSGNATTPEVIGGAYFTNMLDHVHGTLTASSAIITDASSKINNLKVDNIDIDGNTISSTDTNGNIVLDPNGAGTVDVNTSRITNVTDPTGNQDAATKLYVDTNLTNKTLDVATDSGGASTHTLNLTDSDLTFLGVGGIGTRIDRHRVTIELDPTAVTAGSYGSASQIPTFTVNDRGQLTAAGQVSVATNLTVVSDSGSNQTISLLTDQLKLAGGTNIRTEGTGGDTVTVHLDSSLNNLTEVIIGNIKVRENSIHTTDNSGFLYLNPYDSDNTGTVVIQGDLTVEGTTTTVNSTTVSLNDKNLVLADSAADSAAANGAGITINGPRANLGGPVTFLYKSASNTIEFNRPLTTPSASITNLIKNYTTDHLSEGSSNLYFTNERVDDRISNLLLAGEGIDLTYDDAGNSLTVAAELATLTNPGVASFGGYADSAGAPSPGNARQFSVTSGDVSIAIIDGGTY